jgi:hypothetical protein
MKGHIRERSPGHWAIVIDLRDPEIAKGCSTPSVFNLAKRSPV